MPKHFKKNDFTLKAFLAIRDSLKLVLNYKSQLEKLKSCHFIKSEVFKYSLEDEGLWGKGHKGNQKQTVQSRRAPVQTQTLMSPGARRGAGECHCQQKATGIQGKFSSFHL